MNLRKLIIVLIVFIPLSYSTIVLCCRDDNGVEVVENIYLKLFQDIFQGHFMVIDITGAHEPLKAAKEHAIECHHNP